MMEASHDGEEENVMMFEQPPWHGALVIAVR